VRLNVYAEEITGETELVRKVVDTGRVYVGIRVFLRSPDVLHVTENDDDRSAVTFWVQPETMSAKTALNVFDAMRTAARKMVEG
jgi:hypothetical protein